MTFGFQIQPGVPFASHSPQPKSAGTTSTRTTAIRPGGPAASYSLRTASTEFLHSEPKDGKYLNIPQEVWDRVRAKGEDQYEHRLIRIQAWVDQLNDVLARTDITDGEKRGLLAELFGGSNAGNYDDDNPLSIGKLISAVGASDWDSLGELFKDGNDGSQLNDVHMSKLNEKFNETITKWRQQNGIQRPPDTSWAKKWRADQEKGEAYRKQLQQESAHRVELRREEQAEAANRRA